MIGTIKILPIDNSWPKPPIGFGPLMHSPQGLETLLKGLLSEPQGTRALFKADGFTYLARLEPHPPAPERGLKDWHKGVTVYEAKKPSQQTWAFPAILFGMSLFGYILASMVKL